MKRTAAQKRARRLVRAASIPAVLNIAPDALDRVEKRLREWAYIDTVERLHREGRLELEVGRAALEELLL